MATRPNLKVYIVEEPREQGGKAFWHEVGIGWAHENGPGSNLFITAGMAVTGKLVVIENKPQEEPARSPEREARRASPQASASKPAR